MERKITIKKPRNLTRKNHCYFLDDKYICGKQNIYEIENGVITSDGICLKDNSVIFESLHSYRDELEFGRLSSRLRIQKLETIYLDDSRYYLHIQGPQFSYYHWLTDSLPRLWLLKEYLKDTVLILPEKLENVHFVRTSIQMFNINNLYFQPTSKNLKVKHLILPQIRPFYKQYDPEIVCQLREYLISKANIQDNSAFIEKKSRIFISNSFQESEYLFNWQSLVRILKKHGFEIIDISEYTLTDQIHLLSEIEVAVSFNHEYLASMSFMRSGSRIYEISKFPEFESDRFFYRYWSLASSLELPYFHHTYDHKVDCIQPTGQSSIDLNLFEHDLKASL